jgi:hypothetical protein
VQWALHDYDCHLMDCWSGWAGMSEAEAAFERAQKLNPAAFQQYTKSREHYEDDDEDDEGEEEEDDDDDDDDEEGDELPPKVD